MPERNEILEGLLKQSRKALATDAEKALDLARQAIALDSRIAVSFQYAADALMALGRFDEAIEDYSTALTLDYKNGNRHFDLGRAYMNANKSALALASFLKAEQLGCEPLSLGKIHLIIALESIHAKRYDAAIDTLTKAEQLVGEDEGIQKEILNLKALIHSMRGDLQNAIKVINRIKTLNPSDYQGYELAFKIFIGEGRINSASQELEKARRNAQLPLQYYKDRAELELKKFNIDGIKEHIDIALAIIDEGLTLAKPSATEAACFYMDAADAYLLARDADQSLRCLKAAEDPITAFNSGMRVVAGTTGLSALTEYEFEALLEGKADLSSGSEATRGKTAQSEATQGGIARGKTAQSGAVDGHLLDPKQPYQPSPKDICRLNTLFMGAYFQKRDFVRVIGHARFLQESDDPESIYFGKHSEAVAHFALGSPDAENHMRKTIAFLSEAIIKNPHDYAAIICRIQCHTSIREFDEAEELCLILPDKSRKIMEKMVSDARARGR